MRVFVSVLMLCVTSWLGACAKRPQIGDFAHVAFADHPLVGRIYASDGRGWVTRRGLERAMQRHTHVLLGESHDNLDHHRIQSALLAIWLEVHPGGRVAFEQLDEDQGRALAAHEVTSASDVRRYSQWDESGWPAFDMYAPLFAESLSHPEGPLAAHPSRASLRAAMQPDAPPADPALKLEPPPDDGQMQALRQSIVDSHCGHAPGPMLEPMVFAQRFKDAFMARAMADASADAVALIAGAGHVRRDRGVPFYLARQGVTDVVSVAMLPVSPDALTPEDYGVDAYDYVVFTPATSELSACDRFREQLERMQKAHAPPDGA